MAKYKEDELVKESPWSFITKAETLHLRTLCGNSLLVALFCKKTSI